MQSNKKGGAQLQEDDYIEDEEIDMIDDDANN